ncbi:MAG: AAA family ATPase [bacterium]|nr:AAA family ATPase [bacterium]
MYLKRLELVGFKSFAQKTTLEFPTGVVAVVGPNGSGKSNIIDALRWILGEREAKNIRAERSENLIFSGTTQRARSAFAQVAITFDNSTKFFPVDYNEVTIKRRVSRDGTSEYYLNDGQTRLRDIIDFFSKARLGTKGFSIINQGNSDLFIKATPSERRVMLEEVLGLRQYQLKRHESENKLETTKLNLEKVNALVEEILPHLKMLRRQATKWEKHATVEQELKDLENQYFAFKLGQFKKDLEKIEPEIERIEKEVGSKNNELRNLQGELIRIEKNQPSFDKLRTSKGGVDWNAFKKQQTDILNRRSAIQKELGRLEAEVEFILSRPKASVKETELVSLIKDVKKAIAEAVAHDDISAIKGKLKGILERIDQLLEGGDRQMESRVKEIEKVRKNFTDELEKLEKNLSELGNMENKLAGEMREFNVIFKKAFEAVEAKKSEIQALENQKNRFGFDKERITLQMSDLKNQAMQFGRDFNDFKDMKPFFAEASKGDSVDVDGIERRMLKLRGELASIGEIDQALLNEAKEMETRYAFLSTQAADLTTASEDLKKLIQDLKEKIHAEFSKSLVSVNEEFHNYFRLMFNGGKAKLHLVKKPKPVILNEGAALEEGEPRPSENGREGEDKEFDEGGLDIELSIPRKNIKGLDVLSGGERSLVSIAVLFALISVSPPPFLVLDEVDAALDENNTKRFANLIKSFSGKTQFLLVTHNRATMEAATILYGVTMAEDGASRLLSLKLDVDEIPGEVK